MLRFLTALARNVVAVIAYVFAGTRYALGRLLGGRRELYVRVDLESDYAFGSMRGLASFFREEPTLLALREKLRTIQRSDAVDGIVVVPSQTAMGWGRVQFVADLLDEVRQTGTHIVAHLRHANLRDYYLACAADDILIAPGGGSLQTFGPRFDKPFWTELLDEVGVERQLIHIGEFKTAAHGYIYDGMTTPLRSMRESLREAVVDEVYERVASRRELRREEVGTLLREPPHRVRRAEQRDYVDHAVPRGRIDAWLQSDSTLKSVPSGGTRGGLERSPSESDASSERVDSGDRPRIESFGELEGAIPPELNWTPLIAPSRVAVLDLSGLIVAQGMSVQSGTAAAIEPEGVNAKLREIREASAIEALILHIRSPGGSALSSAIISEVIDEVRSTMPVVGYVSDKAGSGGYAFAASTDHLVAHELSYIGGIGIVGGKAVLRRLLDKCGVNVESIYGDRTDTHSSYLHPYDEDLFERAVEDMRANYRTFLRRVGKNRGISRRRLHRYARGRIYRGRGAKRRGLVDEVGGFDDALAAACERAGLDPEGVELQYVADSAAGLVDVLSNGYAASPQPMEMIGAWRLVPELLRRERALFLSPFCMEAPG